ncbi:uncharacterized protein LOC125061688 isoform X2 [Pieris napi]|uniref:uncharacterized protein LOC125061688 isoform X2 n=1 Tax=Pieris napi TaxID=78633 RepID=UPI001FB943D1|nr:uncharacterized protein LOC125061688 isoform X2 [Pieris napi]
MSKRFFPQNYGERKKAKLDVTVSDHNFPLSQNSTSNKATIQSDAWGDDNDDDLLLLASQACEDAYNEQNDSTLPDYTLCMQPGSSSTQFEYSEPSTSKALFAFKKPTSSPYSTISTNLRNKCERISSPLPGLTTKVNKEHVNVSDDFIINDKIFKGQDSGQFYKQLLQLQEENAKLKSENGKLLEKCVTKEGEASILRTQLKTCQISVDNARLEKIKTQEKAQMEWTDKLGNANKQINDLRTQLDFKNLEIISIKEKCKMLESSKIKLTQVTVGPNDTSFSHKQNSYIEREAPQVKRTKSTSSAQTDQSQFLRLNKMTRIVSNLKQFLPLIMESTSDQHSILEYNEKLRKVDASVNKCRVFSTFHRLPSTPNAGRRKKRCSITNVYEDLTCIASGNGIDRYKNFLKILKDVLNEVYSDVSTIAQRLTTAFQREMDEKYIESTNKFVPAEFEDLISGRVLYKEEQGILARRLLAILSILHLSKDNELNEFMDIFGKICALLDTTSSGLLYSGFLISLIHLLITLVPLYISQIRVIIRNIIISRPRPMVSCSALPLLVKLCREETNSKEKGKSLLCDGSSGNLRVDFDQGVLLYRKDSCLLQVLLKQVETALKCMETDRLVVQALAVARNLLLLHSSLTITDNTRCECRLVLLQVIVYALWICAHAIKDVDYQNVPASTLTEGVLATCRSGLELIYLCVTRDVEFVSQLDYHEGHLIQLCEIIRQYEHSEIFGSMLSEISTTFQASPEDETPAFTKQPWINSFQTFSITD